MARIWVQRISSMLFVSLWMHLVAKEDIGSASRPGTSLAARLMALVYKQQHQVKQGCNSKSAVAKCPRKRQPLRVKIRQRGFTVNPDMSAIATVAAPSPITNQLWIPDVLRRSFIYTRIQTQCTDPVCPMQINLNQSVYLLIAKPLITTAPKILCFLTQIL